MLLLPATYRPEVDHSKKCIFPFPFYCYIIFCICICEGIPVEILPSTDTGNVKTVNLKQWLKLREYVERHMLSLKIQQQYQQDHQQYQQQEMMTEHPYQQLQDVTMMDMGGGNNNNNNDCEMDIISSLSQFQSQFQSQSSSPLVAPTSLVTPTSVALSLNIVECPGSNDVIFRRGKSMNNHPGNVQFFCIIESRLDEFTKAKDQKGQQQLKIVLEIIHYIQNIQNGLFLKWNPSNGWWTVINNNSNNSNSNSNSNSNKNSSSATSSDSVHDKTATTTMMTQQDNNKCSNNLTTEELEIQSKVHYAFRDFKKKIQIQQNLQSSKSSTYAFERQDGHVRKRGKIIKNSNVGGRGGAIPLFCGTTPDERIGKIKRI